YRRVHGGQYMGGGSGVVHDGSTEGLREHPVVHLDAVLPDDRARSLAALLRDRDTGSVRGGVDAERLTGAATGEEGHVREVGQGLRERGADEQIGRASCRERVEKWVGGGAGEKKKVAEGRGGKQTQ